MLAWEILYLSQRLGLHPCFSWQDDPSVLRQSEIDTGSCNWKVSMLLVNVGQKFRQETSANFYRTPIFKFSIFMEPDIYNDAIFAIAKGQLQEFFFSKLIFQEEGQVSD